MERIEKDLLRSCTDMPDDDDDAAPAFPDASEDLIPDLGFKNCKLRNHTVERKWTVKWRTAVAECECQTCGCVWKEFYELLFSRERNRP